MHACMWIGVVLLCVALSPNQVPVAVFPVATATIFSTSGPVSVSGLMSRLARIVNSPFWCSLVLRHGDGRTRQDSNAAYSNARRPAVLSSVATAVTVTST